MLLEAAPTENNLPRPWSLPSTTHLRALGDAGCAQKRWQRAKSTSLGTTEPPLPTMHALPCDTQLRAATSTQHPPKHVEIHQHEAAWCISPCVAAFPCSSPPEKLLCSYPPEGQSWSSLGLPSPTVSPDLQITPIGLPRAAEALGRCPG